MAEHFSGDEYEPTPLFMNHQRPLHWSVLEGLSLAHNTGLFVGKRMGQEPEVGRDIWDTVEHTG